ncbi:unnamed protein product, partial [marine sediment metagenome]
FVALAQVTPDYSGQGGNKKITVNKYEAQSDGSGVPKMPTIGDAMKEKAGK